MITSEDKACQVIAFDIDLRAVDVTVLFIWEAAWQIIHAVPMVICEENIGQDLKPWEASAEYATAN